MTRMPSSFVLTAACAHRWIPAVKPFARGSAFAPLILI